jgi:hypothetical protein
MSFKKIYHMIQYIVLEGETTHIIWFGGAKYCVNKQCD